MKWCLKTNFFTNGTNFGAATHKSVKRVIAAQQQKKNSNGRPVPFNAPFTYAGMEFFLSKNAKILTRKRKL